jgi:hypothetical protein
VSVFCFDQVEREQSEAWFASQPIKQRLYRRQLSAGIPSGSKIFKYSYDMICSTMKSTLTTHKKWYQKSPWIITLLILFFPAGLYLMWKYSGWSKTTMGIITLLFGIMILANANATKNSTSTSTPQTIQDTKQKNEEIVEPTKSTLETSVTVKPQVKQTVTIAPTSNVTMSQKNAVRKAQSYLSFSGFSRDGLVAQLEYEKFSHEDSVYGADNSGADWNAQAAKKAKSYMEISGYSRGGLIEQLLYEKFTKTQAEFGADSVGL